MSHAAIGVSSAYGAFEPAALLVVLAFVARRGPAACAAPVALLLAAAVVLRPLSVGVQEGSLAVAFGLTLVTVLVAGASVTARMVEADRRQRAHRIRLEQRIDLARDLHDHLAHHVAGIVVQAQGARAVAARRPDMVLPALQRIEETGAEALAAAILHRVTVESLTNIRKHARHCRHVSVHVRVRPHEAAVRITSDGTARLTSRPGYGLKDLRERVTLGGGTFRAEPTAEGDWQVRARLPLTTPGGARSPPRAAGSPGGGGQPGWRRPLAPLEPDPGTATTARPSRRGPGVSPSDQDGAEPPSTTVR